MNSLFACNHSVVDTVGNLAASTWKMECFLEQKCAALSFRHCVRNEAGIDNLEDIGDVISPWKGERDRCWILTKSDPSLDSFCCHSSYCFTKDIIKSLHRCLW